MILNHHLVFFFVSPGLSQKLPSSIWTPFSMIVVLQFKHRMLLPHNKENGYEKRCYQSLPGMF